MLIAKNVLVIGKIYIKHEIALFYSISRKPTLRIAKIEGIAYIHSDLHSLSKWPKKLSRFLL